MGKLVAAVLGLAALAAALAFATRAPPAPEPEPESHAESEPEAHRSAPAQRLDNVREAKERIEAEQAERLEKALQGGR